MKTSLRHAATPQRQLRPRISDRPKRPSSGQHPRRRFLGLAAGAAALPAVPRIAWAQVYPSRPITMIVPFAAGGPTDVAGRIVAERMRASLGQSVIIENVSGADGSIGIGRAARAKPDGYTINLGILDTQVLNGLFYSLPYDVLNDFVPISPLVRSPQVLFARKTMPANDLYELIGWLKTNPNKATAGVVTVSSRLMTSVFQRETGTQFAVVPYRGAAPEMQDLAASQIDLMFAGAIWLTLVRSGAIKGYAVANDTRSPLAPDIPTFAEMGLPSVFWSTWYGLFAPRGTPRDIIGKLNGAAMGALADPVARSRFTDLGLEIFPREQQTPEALGAMVKAGAEKWWPIIKELGIKAE